MLFGCRVEQRAHHDHTDQTSARRCGLNTQNPALAIRSGGVHRKARPVTVADAVAGRAGSDPAGSAGEEAEETPGLEISVSSGWSASVESEYIPTGEYVLRLIRSPMVIVTPSLPDASRPDSGRRYIVVTVCPHRNKSITPMQRAYVMRTTKSLRQPGMGGPPFPYQHWHQQGRQHGG
jgi:hypothetical protein